MSINTIAKDVIIELESNISLLVVIYSALSLILSIIYKKTDFALVSIGMFVFSYIADRNIIISIFILSITLVFLLEKSDRILATGKYYRIINIEFLIIFAFFVPYYIVNIINIGNVHFNEEYCPYSFYPVKAVDYIIDNVDYKDSKFYTDLNWGSYVEFRGLKAFIDSRTEIFCEEFNSGITVLDEWASFNCDRSIDKFDALVEKYKFDYIILSTRGYDGELRYDDETGNYYIDHADSDIKLVDNSDKYEILYYDDDFSVIEVKK